MARPKLLQKREKTHGSFAENARISQELKDIFDRELDTSANYNDYGDVQCEVLDMIALKLSRILSGKANRKEHWEDIAGYAQLAIEVCDE